MDDVALACVLFNCNETVTTAAIVPNFLKALLEQIRTLSEETMKLYRQCYEEKEAQASLKEILQLLNIKAGRISSFLIVLDALDECTNEANTCAKIVL